MSPDAILIVGEPDAGSAACWNSLTDSGFMVSRAGSVAEGGGAATGARPALIIVDVQSPGKTLPPLPSGIAGRVPLIVGVSVGSPSRCERMPRLGPFAWIEGGIEPGDLKALVSSMITASRKPVSARRKVLVADPQAETSDFLCWILRAAGYEVTAAPDAATALRLAIETKPPFDFAMVALELPGRPSPELLAEMKQSVPATVIVMMAGETPPEEIAKGYAAGGYTLVRKPFKAPVLIPFFSMMDHECDEWKQVLQWRDEEARQPFHTRVHRWFLEAMDAPANTPAKKLLTTIAFIALATALAVFGVWIATTVTHEPDPEEGSFLTPAERSLPG